MADEFIAIANPRFSAFSLNGEVFTSIASQAEVDAAVAAAAAAQSSASAAAASAAQAETDALAAQTAASGAQTTASAAVIDAAAALAAANAAQTTANTAVTDATNAATAAAAAQSTANTANTAAAAAQSTANTANTAAAAAQTTANTAVTDATNAATAAAAAQSTANTANTAAGAAQTTANSASSAAAAAQTTADTALATAQNAASIDYYYGGPVNGQRICVWTRRYAFAAGSWGSPDPNGYYSILADVSSNFFADVERNMPTDKRWVSSVISVTVRAAVGASIPNGTDSHYVVPSNLENAGQVPGFSYLLQVQNPNEANTAGALAAVGPQLLSARVMTLQNMTGNGASFIISVVCMLRVIIG
jgi:hypothetical protein